LASGVMAQLRLYITGDHRKGDPSIRPSLAGNDLQSIKKGVL